MMLKTKLGVVLLCAATIVPAASILRAEKPQDAHVVPMPSQISAAHKVFIANGGGVLREDSPRVTSDLLYHEFNFDMGEWGHYQLVASPSEADLVLQIGFAHYGGLGPSDVRLEMRDPKSNTLLWTIEEEVDIRGRGLEASIQKGIDEAMDRIVKDLMGLTASPAAK